MKDVDRNDKLSPAKPTSVPILMYLRNKSFLIRSSPVSRSSTELFKSHSYYQSVKPKFKIQDTKVNFYTYSSDLWRTDSTWRRSRTQKTSEKKSCRS